MSEGNVNSVEYDEAGKSLLVHYLGGSIHLYTPVSLEEFVVCKNADNLSKAVHAVVRKGNLVGKKVERI